jgi:hypothetical protein
MGSIRQLINHLFVRKPKPAYEKISLQEVFGISKEIPKYTYVDRSNLDNSFAYLLMAQRHIVIHGASKQGKTILRRKILPDDQVVVIQCTPNLTIENVYIQILEQLDVQIPSEMRDTTTTSTQYSAGGEGGIPLAKVKADATATESVEQTVTSIPVGISTNNLQFVSKEIKEHNKRIVIEDFHYLPEAEQRRLAFDLKALWDMGVFLIVVGVWAEQNLLTYYNGDLSGRIEELDIRWTDAELELVLGKGEKVLNIHFSDDIRKQLISDANQNVGLLQRIAEKFCYESSILESQPIEDGTENILGDIQALDRARGKICQEEDVRYRQFSDAIQRGFKGYEESELKVYKHILRIFIEATDEDIKTGIHRDNLLLLVQKLEPRVRLSDLSAALNKINKLQVDRRISPLVISYNTASSSRKLELIDREFLFYRKYGNPSWSWIDEEGE